MIVDSPTGGQLLAILNTDHLASYQSAMKSNSLHYHGSSGVKDIVRAQCSINSDVHRGTPLWTCHGALSRALLLALGHGSAEVGVAA